MKGGTIFIILFILIIGSVLGYIIGSGPITKEKNNDTNSGAVPVNISELARHKKDRMDLIGLGKTKQGILFQNISIFYSKNNNENYGNSTHIYPVETFPYVFLPLFSQFINSVEDCSTLGISGTMLTQCKLAYYQTKFIKNPNELPPKDIFSSHTLFPLVHEKKCGTDFLCATMPWNGGNKKLEDFLAFPIDINEISISSFGINILQSDISKIFNKKDIMGLWYDQALTFQAVYENSLSYCTKIQDPDQKQYCMDYFDPAAGEKYRKLFDYYYAQLPTPLIGKQ